MKMKKADIYAKHGILYRASDGKIYTKKFGWIKPLLVNGNKKIGKGAYHFSTLPTNQIYNVIINNMSFAVKGTCPCTCMGSNGKTACYATKGNYNYKSVIESLAKKTLLCYESLDFVKRAIMAQIEADNIKLVRIHAAGDFFNMEYALMWKSIIDSFPGVTFWTYTKNKACENVFDNCVNGNIVKSFLPNGKVNFGHCDHIMEMYKLLKESGKSVHICFCGIEKYAGIPAKHCTDCHSCATNDYVLFIEHSTDYHADQDPLFPELVKLILSQDSENAKAA